MDESVNMRDTVAEVKLFSKWIISSLLDGLFVAIWAAIQWGAQQAVVNFPLEGVDLWTLRTFQLIFAITTLAPILIYIIMDTTIMIIRARIRVKNELTKLEEKPKLENDEDQ